ncbi:helix-turn-helix domain-containing protein [Mycobacteroides abscessus]|uniref:helix-turn-helix domain-containing protein n=1 Tax=Mycobacteroides abscessus TaxID=36809 RepID=UPI000C265E88|nr:XRE family transcriptional regulator [Mycobacteroides abscessus]
MHNCDQSDANLRNCVAAEVRAEMARQGIVLNKLAAAAGITNATLSRRLKARTPHESFTVDELDNIARALNIPVRNLFPADHDSAPRVEIAPGMQRRRLYRVNADIDTIADPMTWWFTSLDRAQEFIRLLIIAENCQVQWNWTEQILPEPSDVDPPLPQVMTVYSATWRAQLPDDIQVIEREVSPRAAGAFEAVGAIEHVPTLDEVPPLTALRWAQQAQGQYRAFRIHGLDRQGVTDAAWRAVQELQAEGRVTDPATLSAINTDRQAELDRIESGMPEPSKRIGRAASPLRALRAQNPSAVHREYLDDLRAARRGAGLPPDADLAVPLGLYGFFDWKSWPRARQARHPITAEPAGRQGRGTLTVKEAAAQGSAAEADLIVAVEAARARNESWDSIGADLGVSRQQAQRKYGPLIEQLRNG